MYKFDHARSYNKKISISDTITLKKKLYLVLVTRACATINSIDARLRACGFDRLKVRL